MSNYVKSTNFAAKDNLPTSDPAKIIKGTEIDNEFNAIASAVSSKADSNSPSLTGTPTAPTAASGTNTTQIATTAYVQSSLAAVGNIAGGGANRVVYQSATDTTDFVAAPTVSGTYLGWNGSAFAWSTVSASSPNFLTINNSGSGASSGAQFNGSLPVTISYNTVGAPSTTGTNATGTWGINITGNAGSTSFATTAGSCSGNAATVTNGAYLTGSQTFTGAKTFTGGIISSAYNFTSSGNSIAYNGSDTVEIAIGSSSALQVKTAGTYNATGVYGTISDSRIKENIVTARSYVADLCQLRVVNYSLKNEHSDKPTKLGFVAQEVEAVMPGLIEISSSKEFNISDLKSIKTSVLIPMLVQAIQELKAEIDTLKNK